ncbi:MAG TPA: hypothetical protein VKZ94_01860 [Advenella sp.]|nr:hypothetical protein [Advenella sp.]
MHPYKAYPDLQVDKPDTEIEPSPLFSALGSWLAFNTGVKTAVEKHIRGSSDGWLNVRREPEGTLVALPEYLLVEYDATHVGRDYFKVLEGVEKSNRFTVIEGNLSNGRPVYRPAAHLRFDLAAETLT